MEKTALLVLAIILVTIGIIILASSMMVLFGYSFISGAAAFPNLESIDQEAIYSEKILLVNAYLDSLTKRSNRVLDDYSSGKINHEQTISEYEDIAMRADLLLQAFKQLKSPEGYSEFHQKYQSALEYYTKSKYAYLSYLKGDNEKYKEYNELYTIFSTEHSLSIDMLPNS